MAVVATVAQTHGSSFNDTTTMP